METICGYKIEVAKVPFQHFTPKPFKFSEIEQEKIDREMKIFEQKGIIERVMKSDDSDREFISNIFTRPKKDGRVRIILNLKQFNERFMEKQHFKMETLHSAIDSMRKDCYFGSVDLSEAYYSISIFREHRRFFRFIHKGQKFQFTALIMGLSSSPRIFTKVLKPVFASLRGLGHVSSAYIDDSCLQGLTYLSCWENIRQTVSLMDDLGFTIHPTKSVLTPCQQIVFLGFILCSTSMTVRLAPVRYQEIVKLCQDLLVTKRLTIRAFSKVIGKLVAAEPGVQYAVLYTKPLEKIKEIELKSHRGNFDSFMNVPAEIKPTLLWWIDNLPHSFKKLSHGPPMMVIYTDSSLQGWGAYDKTNNIKTGGAWSMQEKQWHINVLELKACYLALCSLCKNISNAHVQVFMDNTTSVSYINKYGGRKSQLDRLARLIWFWCIDHKIHISAAHVAGKLNVEADEMSRIDNDDTEWSLNDRVFKKIIKLHPNLDIDLFASRLNHKLMNYVSHRPEPQAIAIDAFSMTWANHVFYMFPPFSIMARILQKIVEDKTEMALLVAPLWPTQSWWPCLLELICGPCHLLPGPQTLLSLPHRPGIKHPLKKMKLAAFPLSGKSCIVKEFRKTLPSLLSNLGDPAHRNNMNHILNHGYFIVGGKRIPLLQI